MAQGAPSREGPTFVHRYVDNRWVAVVPCGPVALLPPHPVRGAGGVGVAIKAEELCRSGLLAVCTGLAFQEEIAYLACPKPQGKK